MPRSRNLKPGFFANDLLAEVEPLGRLLFAGLWTVADRVGRLEDRPKRIKAAVLPYDDADVDGLLDDLSSRGFILRYEVAGKRFIQVQNFAKHQNPHCREPESTIPAPDEHSACMVQEQDEHRTGPADSLLLIPDSLNLIPDEPPCSPSASESADDGFADFWMQYPKKVAKPQALKAWKKLKPAGPLLADLMAGLQRQMVSDQWRKEGGQFIPYPATWLNGRRWEDGEQQTVPAEVRPAGAQPGDTRQRQGITERFDEVCGWMPA